MGRRVDGERPLDMKDDLGRGRHVNTAYGPDATHPKGKTLLRIQNPGANYAPQHRAGGSLNHNLNPGQFR